MRDRPQDPGDRLSLGYIHFYATEPSQAWAFGENVSSNLVTNQNAENERCKKPIYCKGTCEEISLKIPSSHGDSPKGAVVQFSCLISFSTNHLSAAVRGQHSTMLEEESSEDFHSGLVWERLQENATPTPINTTSHTVHKSKTFLREQSLQSSLMN